MDYFVFLRSKPQQIANPKMITKTMIALPKIGNYIEDKQSHG